MIPAEYTQAVRKASPRPASWDDVIGNRTAVEIVREAIAATELQRPASPHIACPHMLMFAVPGSGKTTISNLVAKEIGAGFISTTASTLERPEDMVRILWDLNDMKERTGRPSVLFIDEIHALMNTKSRQAIDSESLFPLLEDFVFPHNLLGKSVRASDGVDYPLTTSETLVWPFTCIGATTDPGALPQALLRRFLVHIELEPYTEDDIRRIILVAARLMDRAITDAAAAEISKYARCNPGRSYQLLTQAHNRAVASGRAEITAEVAQETITRLRLYPLGLTETDVRILRLLADRIPRGVGMAEIARAVNISQGQYAQMIEPFLRHLAFVETLSRRCIRPEGLRYLAQLGHADMSRPEVRAAVEMAQ